jgi:hypothetical protein
MSGPVKGGRSGDDKQLPPTTFFQVDVEDDYDEESDPDTTPLESILDECAAIPSFGRGHLKWHYRSRREGLIAFSNREFYDGELITFPAPTAADHSVRFEYTPHGIYDRGASRTNRAEARRVAELVIKHFETYGRSQSLGVIALSVAQEHAIDDELMRVRPSVPHLEPFFAEDAEDIEEPFFVKNLENVQGDQRDRIIISIGYGRDVNGVLSLNFGPINRAGGERRLNVAITRARWETTVVCSFLPHELDLTRLTTHNVGVAKLQAYLEYAYRGEFVSEAAGIGAESNEFEEAVRAALEREGLRVDMQVGCSGFRVDLAVRHPDQKGRYAVIFWESNAMVRSTIDLGRRAIATGCDKRFSKVLAGTSFAFGHTTGSMIRRLKCVAFLTPLRGYVLCRTLTLLCALLRFGKHLEPMTRAFLSGMATEISALPVRHRS